MRIYIPTLNRRTLRTIPWMPPELRKITTVVSNHDPDISPEIPFGIDEHLVLPPGIEGISNVRKYIIDNTEHDKIVMLDDDLKFYRRVSMEVNRLIYADEKDMIRMFRLLDKQLDSYAHVGLSPREGNNRDPWGWNENVRMIRCLGYDVEVVRQHVELGRVPVMEDFDIALQLLRAGYKNCVTFEYAQGQIETQEDGGCSTYRTHELHEAAAYKLAELHPRFVRLRDKRNRYGGEFRNRKEVTIYWKKAWKSSREMKK